MITITAFAWVPDFARGFVKDLRVRWALEEAGLAYRTRLISLEDRDSAEYRAMQPFGQVPVFEENGLKIFETGAIILHLGERSEALLPKEPGARARARQWMFAALNSIEPFAQELTSIDLFHAGEDWARLRRPGAEEFVRVRLRALAAALADKPYLDGDHFTAGDLMMTTVLRELERDRLIDSEPRLAAYVARCTGRPAFARAYAAQLGDFRDAA